MGRTSKVVGALVVVAGAATAVALVAVNRSSSSDAAAKAPQQTSTVAVQRKDLVTYSETTATLGFTTSVTVSSPVAGTITTIAASGDTIDAGTVVASIDGAPVVALIGDVPGYRDLSTSSSDGADVRLLEQNLVLLGFDPDSTITIDEHFDSATAKAVTRWEDSLGLDGDGTVPQSEIVYIPGKLLVDSVSTPVGASVAAGGAMLTARQTQRQFLVAATVDGGGAVEQMAAAGYPVSTGTVLFHVAGHPVVAIEGDPAALPALDRDLSVGVSDGADVKLLEQMLVAGGFATADVMTPDDHFDDVTAWVAEAWMQSLGVAPATGKVVVPKGSFVVVPAELVTGTGLVADGTAIPGDAVVTTLSAPAREVTTTAPIGDATFAVGAKIDVEFPDGTVQPGTVVAVGNVATNSSDTPGATPTVPITIDVEDIPASVDSFVQIPVTLRVVSDTAPNAFVVPVSALVALAEGGYAIQVVDGAPPDGTQATHLIGVTTGLFSDGFVAVTGDQLKEGLQVVVPS